MLTRHWSLPFPSSIRFNPDPSAPPPADPPPADPPADPPPVDPPVVPPADPPPEPPDDKTDYKALLAAEQKARANEKKRLDKLEVDEQKRIDANKTAEEKAEARAVDAEAKTTASNKRVASMVVAVEFAKHFPVRENLLDVIRLPDACYEVEPGSEPPKQTAAGKKALDDFVKANEELFSNPGDTHGIPGGGGNRGKGNENKGKGFFGRLHEMTHKK